MIISHYSRQHCEGVLTAFATFVSKNPEKPPDYLQNKSLCVSTHVPYSIQ